MRRRAQLQVVSADRFTVAARRSHEAQTQTPRLPRFEGQDAEDDLVVGLLLREVELRVAAPDFKARVGEVAPVSSKVAPPGAAPSPLMVIFATAGSGPRTTACVSVGHVMVARRK